MIEENVPNICRRCFRPRESLSEHRVLIYDYYGMLVSACGIREWSEDVCSYKVEKSRRRKHLEWASAAIAIIIACVAAALVDSTVGVMLHARPA